MRRNGGGRSGHGYRIASWLTDHPLETSAWRTREHRAAFKAIVPTVVLQGNATFSAAEDFLVAVESIPHLTTVGAPTGGSTGQPLVFDLPGGGWGAVVTAG